jgi:hypothetical protein
MNQNAGELSIDNEDYFDEIKNLLEDKQREDLIACETNFIRNLSKILSVNHELYNEFNELYAYINSVDTVKSITVVLEKFNPILSLCFPVIISSPQSASELFPTTRGLFDYVVIDEASQLSVDKAIPIIYRGKRFCIFGDRKQTPPSDLIENIKFAYDPATMITNEDRME